MRIEEEKIRRERRVGREKNEGKGEGRKVRRRKMEKKCTQKRKYEVGREEQRRRTKRD